jgi:flagellar hook-basal body complex protein FliE
VTKEEIKAATLRNQPILKQLIQSRVTGISSQQLDQLFKLSRYGQLVDVFSRQMAAIITSITAQQQAAQQQAQQIIASQQGPLGGVTDPMALVQEALMESYDQESIQQEDLAFYAQQVRQKLAEISSRLGDVWNALVEQVVNEAKTRGLNNTQAQKILQTTRNDPTMKQVVHAFALLVACTCVLVGSPNLARKATLGGTPTPGRGLPPR